MRTVVLSADERDALRDLILDQLGGSDDLSLAITRNDRRTAETLGGVYHDYLTLMCWDLGWRDGGGTVESLSTPDDMRARACGRLREAAQDGYWVKDRLALEAIERRNRLVLDVCTRELAASNEPAAST